MTEQERRLQSSPPVRAREQGRDIGSRRGAVTVRTMVVRGGSLLASLACLAAVACNTVDFYDAPPPFRGIVVPLPPPSFADADVIEISVEGTVDANPPGTRVLLYEYTQALGLFTYPDDAGDYAFDSVPVVLGDNCLQLDILEGGDELLPTQLFEVVLKTGSACDSVATCSAVDEVGDCACLEPRYDLDKCSM